MKRYEFLALVHVMPNHCITWYCNELDSTYSYIHKLSMEFSGNGVLRLSKSGKRSFLAPTEKGSKVTKAAYDAMQNIALIEQKPVSGKQNVT